MAIRTAQKPSSKVNLEEVKALIQGLPGGLDLANRLAIFKKNFSVSKRGFRQFGGPTDDTLNNAVTGKNWPNESTMEELCKAATAALVSKYPGLGRREAACAGKWLANGPIQITSLLRPEEQVAPTDNRDELNPYLPAIDRALMRLHEARDCFECSTIKSAWDLMIQSINALEDRFRLLGSYNPQEIPSIEQALANYLTVAERACFKLAVGTEAEESCRKFGNRIVHFGKLHSRLTGRTETFIIGDPELRFRLANFNPLLEERRAR